MHQSIVESGLNLKNRIMFEERSDENIIRFFEFKADSTIGWCILFYTLLASHRLFIPVV